jgi:hypothetical protein
MTKFAELEMIFGQLDSGPKVTYREVSYELS